MKGCSHLSGSNQLIYWGRQQYFTPCTWRVNTVNRSCSRSVFLSAFDLHNRSSFLLEIFTWFFFPVGENKEDSRLPHSIVSVYLAYHSHSTISCHPGEQWPCTPVFTLGQSITAADTYPSCLLLGYRSSLTTRGFFEGKWEMNIPYTQTIPISNKAILKGKSSFPFGIVLSWAGHSHFHSLNLPSVPADEFSSPCVDSLFIS